MSFNSQFLFGALTGIGGLTLKTILNIMVYPFILSSLGGTGFGLYMLLLGIVELLIAMDLGFTSGLTQRLSTTIAQMDQATTRQFLSTGLILYLIITLLVLITLFLVPAVPHFLNIEANLTKVATYCLYLVVLESALTLLQGYFSAVLQANCKYQCVNTSETLYYLISNGGIFILLHFGLGLQEITLLRLVAAIIKFGLVFFHCIHAQQGCLDFTHFKLDQAKNLLQISIHSMVKNVSDIAAGRMDLLVISKFLTLQDVGLYAFTYRFLNLAAEFPVRFSAGVYPVFTRLHILQEHAQARLLFLRLSSVLYLGINLAVLLLAFFYTDLFRFFAHEKIHLQASWPIFQLAIPGVISMALYLSANHYLFAAGQHRYVSISSVFMAIAKLTLSITLVKMYGLPGVVLATLLVRCTFHQFIIIRKACQQLAISLRHYLWDVHFKMVLPVLAAALILCAVKNSLWFSQSLFLNLAACASATFTGGFIVWFLTTASEFETNYITTRLDQLRQQHSSIRPIETNH